MLKSLRSIGHISIAVIPAKAGIQDSAAMSEICSPQRMDSRFRGNDEFWDFLARDRHGKEIAGQFSAFHSRTIKSLKEGDCLRVFAKGFPVIVSALQKRGEIPHSLRGYSLNDFEKYIPRPRLAGFWIGHDNLRISISKEFVNS